MPKATPQFEAEYGLAARMQAMEKERERERKEREQQLKEIAELKHVVMAALQDPDKRKLVKEQQQTTSKIAASSLHPP